MRLQQVSEYSAEQAQKIEAFANWLLEIGNGLQQAKARGDDTEATWIKIPIEYMIDVVEHLVKAIFFMQLIQTLNIKGQTSAIWQREQFLHLGMKL
jgi:hypothetical protein